MEVQIQDLVSAIKKDGIDSANSQAAAILDEAKKQASEIIAAAQSEAAKLRENAETEISVFKNSAVLSAEQAKRDAVLAFRQEVQAEGSRLLAADVSKALDPAALVSLIRAALQGEDPAAYTAEVASVSESLSGQLADEIRAGLEICPSKKAGAGFRLTAKDGSGYIDCSDEALTQLLSPFFRDMTL